MIRCARRWGPAVVVMGVIFLASHTPGEDLPDLGGWDLLAKKGAHALGYVLLSAAYWRALEGRPGLRRALGAVGLALGYAVTDEWHQSLVPGRHPAALDVAIDLIGALAGAGLMTGWARRPQPR